MAFSSVDSQISEISKRHLSKLQQYILQNIEEIPHDTIGKNPNNGFEEGSYGRIIDLKFKQGTSCVGKVLHSIFFDFETEPLGMHRRPGNAKYT